MELAVGYNILCSEQLTKNGNQASMREKQAQIYHIKSICFLISADQKRYIFLLKQMRVGDNVVRNEYTVTTTWDLDILIRTEGGILRNQQ